MRDAQDHTAVLITADLVGFDRAFTDLVTSRIQKEYGLPRESVALFASHTHTGPQLRNTKPMLVAAGLDPELSKPNDAFRRDLEAKTVAVVGQARERLRPVELAYGVGQATFAINRREKTPNGYRIGLNPEGPIDSSVPVLRVTDPQGSLVAVLFGYACHNTTLTDKVMTISGDYAGFAQANSKPTTLARSPCSRRGAAATPTPTRANRGTRPKYGHELADAVDAVLGRADGLQPVSGTLRVAYEEPAVPFAGPTDRDSYEKRLDGPKGSPRVEHAKRLIAQLDAGEPIRTTYPYPVQVFGLGDSLVLVALAGEVVVDYSLRLKSELAAARARRLDRGLRQRRFRLRSFRPRSGRGGVRRRRGPLLLVRESADAVRRRSRARHRSDGSRPGRTGRQVRRVGRPPPPSRSVRRGLGGGGG